MRIQDVGKKVKRRDRENNIRLRSKDAETVGRNRQSRRTYKVHSKDISRVAGGSRPRQEREVPFLWESKEGES